MIDVQASALEALRPHKHLAEPHQKCEQMQGCCLGGVAVAVGTPTAASRAGALSVPDSWPDEACSQARALEPSWALASALRTALYFSSVCALKRCSCLVLLETVFWFPLFMLIHCCCALKQKECSNV